MPALAINEAVQLQYREMLLPFLNGLAQVHAANKRFCSGDLTQLKRC